MLRFSKKILSARKSSTLNLVFQTASFSSITTKETTTSQKLVPSSPIVHEVPNITKNLELMKGKGQSAYFDFIEHWSRGAFYNTGYGLSAIAVTLSGIYGICQETLIVDFLVFGYWVIGYNDIHQKHHTVLRNFPVLGNIRYFLEMLRPELRQYLLETDDDGKPYDRMSRSMTYQRAKGVRDTLPFGTRLDVYSPGKLHDMT